MSEKELKPCPFCGSTKLKIDSKQRVAGCTGINAQVESMTCSVRCNVCHARGGTASGMVIQGNLWAYIDSMPEWATTEDALKDTAIELWNNRAQEWAREESKREHGAKNKQIEEIVKIICPYRADDGKCTCNQHQFGVRKCADPCVYRDRAEQLVDAGYAPVAHGERKFVGLDFDGVDEILKKHRAFVMATINGHGCHIGTYKKISLEADGDWIIDVDVESLDVTGQGDVAPVVHGEWLRVSDDDQYEGEYYCSVCNAEEFFPNNAPFAPFCWHCGAKMDGGTE